MNELLFLFHTLFVVGSALFAVRLGREALIALSALLAVLANVFVVKQISLFGLFPTASDVYAVGAVATFNLLQEYFGKSEAKRALHLSFLALLFFGAMAQLHLLYTSAPFDRSQGAFEAILSPTWRLVFASLFAFYLSQRFDLWFFGKLKERPSWPLALRMPLSIGLSQLLDTLLFTFLGLYGVLGSLFDVILVSFAVKCVVVALSTPLIHFSKRYIREPS